MKILGFIGCHYAGNYAREALQSIAPFCDKVYICHSVLPSHGFSTNLECPETAYEINKMATEVLGDKLIFESWSIFDNEQSHRFMRYRYAKGMDYILTIDLDEVFLGIPNALRFAENHPSQYYGTRHYKHFIKDLKWYFEDGYAPIRLESLKCKDGNENDELPLTVLHLSLCQSPDLISYKIETFGHKNEIHPDFYEKWLNWSEDKIDEITDLHPTLPALWHKPSLFEGELPELLKNHKPKIKQKMRILLIPLDFQRHNTNPELFTDMLDSFLTVTDTMLYQGDLNVAINYKPDVILFQGSLLWDELFTLKKETNALTLMFTGDCRLIPMQSLMDYRSIVDAYLVPFSGQLQDTYKTLLGKPVHFLWEAIQNWRFIKPQMMETGYTTFVGNRYDNLPGIEGRDDLFWVMDREESVKCWGNGFPLGELSNERVPAVYNESYIVIAENNHSSIDSYFTPRNIGGLSAGSCTLMKYFPGIERFFQNLVHCIYYKDKYELLQWIEFLKNNQIIRNNIASQGYGLVNEKFTMNNWVKDLMYIINKNYIR